MNFLAHLFLSFNGEEVLIGNFMGDFVSNRDLPDYPEGVRQGVLLHRRIDAFTDQHPLVLQGVRRLRPYHRKYAPVVVDVYYDYLLAYNWERYHDEPLRVYTRTIYAILLRRLGWLPPELQKRLPFMIADDWLMRYGTIKGLEFAFSRMKKRTSRPEFLEKPVENLITEFYQWDQEFNAFFPDIIAFVRQQSGG